LHIIPTKTEKVRHFSNPEVLLCYCPAEKAKKIKVIICKKEHFANFWKNGACLIFANLNFVKEFCVFKKEILQEKDAQRRRRQKTRFLCVFLIQMYSQGIECSMQRVFCTRTFAKCHKQNAELAAGLAGFEHTSCL
jgi:hypothetical protein